MAHKKWQLKEIDNRLADDLNTGFGLDPVTARILAGREMTSLEEAGLFLNPQLASLADPFQMKGVSEAVERLLSARSKGELVCIYGDYDVDGITGTALLVSFLRSAGFNCSYFIPNRFDDGYGLNSEAIHRIAALGAKLIISVDCGITAVEEAVVCSGLGMELIIVDHHTPAAVIPAAAAVVNPLQPGCSYPFKALAGVGVAFNLLIALRSALRNAGFYEAAAVPDLRQWLDLVALGTVADVVPLVGQNRILVSSGLKLMVNPVRPGLRALKKVAGVDGAVNCGHVGFRLAPRLNAAGRMESAVPGVELLLGDDEIAAALIAQELDTANAERQQVERSIFEDAVRMIEKNGRYPDCRSIVLASPDWHQGVVGIVASRLVERYNRPTILIAVSPDGTAKGSGRSIRGFHLLDALRGCSGRLARFGGHRYAAGVGLMADELPEFAAAFEAEAAARLTEDDLVPLLEVDVEVEPEQVTSALVSNLKRLEPFGAGNPEPVLAMRGVRVLDRRVVGEGHLRLKLECRGVTFGAIGFRMAQLETEGLLDMAFYPEMNEWNGSSTLQLKLKDIRRSQR